MSCHDTIDGGWESYRAQCLPADASIDQVTECRRAFFSGAMILMTLLMRGVGEAGDPLPRLIRELKDFQQDVARGIK